MVYRESSEMVRLLAGAGGIFAGLALVLAAAALYYRYKRKNAVLKGCALRMLFFVIAALPIFVVPLLAYASESGNGALRGRGSEQEVMESESPAESETGTETGTETERAAESKAESGTDTETESGTETESESGTDTPIETETEAPGLDEQELAKLLEDTEWDFLDDTGKPLRLENDVLLTGGTLSKPDQIHLQIHMKDPAVEKALGGESAILFQVLGGPETWRKEVQHSFRKAEEWKKEKGRPVWEMSFAEDGNYLIQIGVSRGEKEIPLICSETKVIVDTTAPEAVFEGLPERGLFSRKDHVVQVYVKDANPDEQAVPTAKTEGLRADFSGWEREEIGLSGELVLEGEGSAILSFTARDKAGNLSEPLRSGQVVIDKTPPDLEIAPPAGKQSGSLIYVSSASEIVISASDPYFDISESSVSVHSDKGSWSTGSWQQEDGQWKLHVNLDGDGSYSVFAKGRDYAGNESDQTLGQRIVADSAPPSIRITGAADGMSYKTLSDLEIQAEDGSLSDGKLHIYLLNQLTDKKIEKTLSPGEDTAFWKQELTEDGIYILQVNAEDGAGNTRGEELRFRINAAGSTIEPDERTAQVLLSGFMKNASSLVFTEKNIDKLQERRLLLGGSRPRVLKEGTDYRVRETIEKNGMYSYRYEISQSCFTKEGYYTLHIYSKDAAGNEYAGSQSKALLHFAADYHSPDITVTGLEDGAVYRNQKPAFTVSVSDTVGVSKLRVSVGGRVVLERDAQGIREAGGVFPLTLEPSQNIQEICVEAVDAAGRSADSRIFRVLVPEEMGKLSEKEEQFVKEAAAESTADLPETEVYSAADVFTDAAGGLEKTIETKQERTFLILSLFGIAGFIICCAVAIRKRKGKSLSKEDTSS